MAIEVWTTGEGVPGLVVGASVGADRAQAQACEARFVKEVLPELRA